MTFYINGAKCEDIKTIGVEVPKENARLMPLFEGTGTFEIKDSMFPRMSPALKSVFKIMRWNGKVYW